MLAKYVADAEDCGTGLLTASTMRAMNLTSDNLGVESGSEHEDDDNNNNNDDYNNDHFVQPATQNNINDNDSSDDEQQVFM